MKTEKIYRSIFLTLFLLIIPTVLQAGNFHVILVTDTRAANIESSVAADQANMSAFVHEVSKYTDLALNEKIFNGENLTSEALYKYIDGLQVTEEDVVLFYYSGHGFRTMSKGDANPWPSMFFSLEKVGVDFYALTMTLADKLPRLMFSLADCCNNFIPEGRIPMQSRFFLFQDDRSKEVYRKLFLDSQGMIMISTSEKGELSWCIPKGALYTLAFLETLKEETSAWFPSTSWESILDKAAFKVRFDQKPIVDLHLIDSP